MTYQARVIAGGKIVIPAELRRELGIKDGDSLVIERESGGGLVIKTYGQVVGEVQSAFAMLLKPGVGSLVDDLLAERQIEAARELAANEASQAHHRS